MAERRILTLPDDLRTLRRRCVRVGRVDDQIRQVIADLKDTWETQAAYGIAAPQIGERFRIILVNLAADAPQPLIILNPEITAAAGEVKDFDGCLSIPGIYADTRRAAGIRLRGRDENGRPLDLELTGFAARIVQHEVDHLDGVLFIDRLDAPADLHRLVRTRERKLERAALAPDELDLLLRARRPLPRAALTWAPPEAAPPATP